MILGYCINNTCRINETLTRENNLTSSSGECIFYMEENATLFIVYDEEPVWSTEDNLTDAEGLCLQSDGHVVIYKNGGTIMWTFLIGSGKPKGEKLVLQDNGKLVLLASDHSILWDSVSHGRG